MKHCLCSVSGHFWCTDTGKCLLNLEKTGIYIHVWQNHRLICLYAYINLLTSAAFACLIEASSFHVYRQSSQSHMHADGEQRLLECTDTLALYLRRTAAESPLFCGRRRTEKHFFLSLYLYLFFFCNRRALQTT